ncbi:MAG: iron-sulfur cluster assembly scaffold protein [Candidatus Diapherotrites archaeon]|nr:iron-sulfur cluster assembly scaffold protein [Candidatus Diapherotrites archaeon]
MKYPYSKRVIEHFRHPHHMGRMKNPDAVGVAGNPVCGDVMYIYIKVKDNRIIDLKWETMGCAAAIATTSMLADLAIGKTLDEAEKLTKKEVADALEGLPPIKMHCSNLAADALRDAIKKYREKHEN